MNAALKNLIENVIPNSTLACGTIRHLATATRPECFCLEGIILKDYASHHTDDFDFLNGQLQYTGDGECPFQLAQSEGSRDWAGWLPPEVTDFYGLKRATSDYTISYWSRFDATSNLYEEAGLYTSPSAETEATDPAYQSLLKEHAIQILKDYVADVSES